MKSIHSFVIDVDDVILSKDRQSEAISLIVLICFRISKLSLFQYCILMNFNQVFSLHNFNCHYYYCAIYYELFHYLIFFLCAHQICTGTVGTQSFSCTITY